MVDLFCKHTAWSSSLYSYPHTALELGLHHASSHFITVIYHAASQLVLNHRNITEELILGTCLSKLTTWSWLAQRQHRKKKEQFKAPGAHGLDWSSLHVQDRKDSVEMKWVPFKQPLKWDSESSWGLLERFQFSQGVEEAERQRKEWKGALTQSRVADRDLASSGRAAVTCVLLLTFETSCDQNGTVLLLVFLPPQKSNCWMKRRNESREMLPFFTV